ncbi:hypothetical protein F5887DRAFT_1072518 [Amanita rubescens]|nr:hypothetical protein F5887DRAFT_1072518 [Amanita rubescens]
MPKELRDTKLNSPGALRGSRHLPYPNPLWRPSVGFRLSRLIGSAYEHTRTPGKSIPDINSTQHVEKPSTKVKTEAPTASRSSRRATSVSTSELITHTDEHTFGSSHNSSTQSVSRDATRFKATHAPRVKQEVLRTSKSPGESTVTPVIETCRLGQTPTRSQPKSDWLEPRKPVSETQLATRREDSLRVLNNASGTGDSTLESRNTPRRVQVTRTQERPSSLKPDSTLTSRELQRSSPRKSNEPAIARGLDSRRKLPSESSKKTESSVSHTPSRKSNTRDKRIPLPVLEPSVLVRKLPDKSTGVVGSSSKSRVVAAVARCAPGPRVGSKLKFQIGNKTVSTKERESAADYAPLAETAPSLSESLPVSSIQANPPVLLKDELILAPSWLPKRCEPRVVNTAKSIVSKITHHTAEARRRALSQTGNPWFGDPPAERESVHAIQAVKAKEISPLLPDTPTEHPPRSSDILALMNAPVHIPSFSSEMGEKRQDSYAVINIQRYSEEVSSPKDPATVMLSIPVPAVHSSPPASLCQSTSMPKSAREVVSKRNDAVVTIRRESEENSSLGATAASSPPSAASAIPPFIVAPVHIPPNKLTLVPVQHDLVRVNITTLSDKDEEASSPAPPACGTPHRQLPNDASPPVEVVSRRRGYSVVSVRRGSEEISSPDDVAVLALPVPVPVISPVLSVHLEPSGEPVCEDKPPVEVVSRRRDLNAISKASRVSNVYSPLPRTARKQSKLLITPSEPSEGKLLAKAVVHAQERTTRRSSIYNDTACRNLKIPLSRTTTSESKLQRVGNATVSTEKLASSLERVPFTKEASLVSKPSPVSPIPAVPSSPLQDELILSPPRVSKRRESRVVNTKQTASKITHRRNETRSKVPESAADMQTGKTLFVLAAKGPQQSERTVEIERNVLLPLKMSQESTTECSTSAPGLVDIQVQSSLLPIELGEKRRVYDATVVSKQHISEEVSSPDASVASTLSVTAPATSPVHPRQAELVRQTLDESKPSIEVVTRQRHLNVVNKRSTVSEVHSRNSETVQRQSKPDNSPSEVSEGRYLASAAAYVQERKRRRSLDCDETVRRPPKGPSDKMVESSSSCDEALSFVRKGIDASVNSRSPESEPEDSESPPVRPKAAPQQLITPRVKELSIPCSKPVPHHPESTLEISHAEISESRAEKHLEAVNAEERAGDDPQVLKQHNEAEEQLRDPHTVNDKEMSSDLHSPDPCMALAPLTHTATLPTQAVSPHQLKDISFESHQLFQHLTQLGCVPDCLNSSRRRVLDIISETAGISESLHSPAFCTVPVSIPLSAFTNPVLPLPTTQLNSVLRQLVRSSTQSSNELDWSSSLRRYPCDVVSSTLSPNTNRHSPKFEVELIPPIPKPVGHPVNIPCRRGSSEFSWRARCKPPDSAVATRQRNDDVVNTNVNPSVSRHSPSSRIANELSTPPPKTLWWAEASDSTCVEGVWRTRYKPPDVAVNHRRQNYDVVNKTNSIGEYDSPLLWAETMPPKSISVLGDDPGTEAEAMIESGHSLTDERRAESPRCQYPRSSRSLLASP